MKQPLLVALLLLSSAPAAAQDAKPAGSVEDPGQTASAVPAPATTPATAPAAVEDPADVTARELNRYGVALLDAGDTARALEYFMRSRDARPTAKNTANAATCLVKMARWDEALELYEELLLKHARGLDAEDRGIIEPAMAALRQKVGSVVVSANIAGAALLVDGRVRGKLPLPGELRVLGGKRQLRFVKAGYATVERTVEVRVGETVTVAADLSPIRGVGQVLVEDSVAGSEVWIDSVKVGTAPWEGSLAPGRHLVWTRKANMGSLPASLTVVEGQTALARLESRPLGGAVRVRVEPRTADLELDGVTLGAGSWDGRLPPGSYTVTAREAGYHTRSARVAVGDGGAASDVPIGLEIDPSHPRWPARGRLWIEGYGGYAGGATLQSGAESRCPEACDGDPSVNGWAAGARAGYRFPFGTSIELGGGFMALGVSPSVSISGPNNVQYQLDHDLRVRGPFASLGVSQRVPLGKRLHLDGRATVGLLFARSQDALDGQASTGNEVAPLQLDDRNQEKSSAAVFVAPELGAGVTVAGFDLGISLGVAVFTTDGPDLERARLSPAAPDDTPLGDAQESDALARQQAYGRFLLWMPRASIGRSF